jgi:hypothetical protein
MNRKDHKQSYGIYFDFTSFKRILFVLNTVKFDMKGEMRNVWLYSLTHLRTRD